VAARSAHARRHVERFDLARTVAATEDAYGAALAARGRPA
jgi:hypothetical protein